MENQSVAQKLEALVKLQFIDSKLDELKKLRGDLPDEVQDLEDEIEGYQTRLTRFEVEQSYVEQFVVQTVGGRIHQELWVPAEQLDEFNRHIISPITVEATYYGPQFQGDLDPQTNLPHHISYNP